MPEHRRARTRLTVLGTALSLALMAGATRSQETSGQAQREAPGRLAPAGAWAWARLRGLPALSERLDGHALSVAWRDLVDKAGPLSKSLVELGTQLRLFAKAMNLSEQVMLQLLGTDARISLVDNGKGTDLVIFLKAGEHVSLLQGLLESKPSVKGSVRDVRWLEHPIAGGGRLAASFEHGWLAIGSSSKVVEDVLPLLQGRSPCLADEPAFAALNSQKKSGWLTLFVRPLEAVTVLGMDEASDGGRFVMQSGVSMLQGVRFSSTFTERGLVDELLALLPEKDESRFPLDFIAASTPGKELARLIPADAANWFAARIAPAGLLAFLERSRVSVPGLGRLEIFGADLEAHSVKGLADLAGMLGDQLLWLRGAGDQPAGVVLTLTDAGRLKTLLGKLGNEALTPGAKDQGISRFTIERGGSKLWATIADDHLLLTSSETRMEKLLQRYFDGVADPKVVQTLQDKDAWLVGIADPRLALMSYDGDETRGFSRIATHFDQIRTRAKLGGRTVALEFESTTGTSHAWLLALDRLVPHLIARERSRARQIVFETVSKLLSAQRSFRDQKSHDRDEDGIGESGAIADLIAQKLFAIPPTFVTTGDGVLEGGGYRFRILHPETIDGAETSFAIVAWPARPGVSGRASFLATTDGSTHEHPWIPTLDADTGPTLQQIFETGSWDGGLHPAWQKRERAVAAPQPTEQEPPAAPSAPTTEDIARAQILMDQARRRMDPAAIQPYLIHTDARLVARAAHYLGDIKDRHAIPELARLLKESPELEIRRRAARALCLIRDPKCSATLIQFVADKDPKIRLFAATGMLGNPSPSTTRALLDAITAYTTDEEGERSQAVLAIHDTRDADALEPLTTVSEGGPLFQESLVYCFQALSPTLEREREQEILTKALVSPNRALRRYAIQRIGAAEMTDLLPTLQARMAKEEPALTPALVLSIEALTPEEKPGLREILANVGESAQEMVRKLGKQPVWVQRAMALTPFALLVLWSLYWWSRRRSRMRRRQEETLALAQTGIAGDDSGVYAPVHDGGQADQVYDSDVFPAVGGEPAPDPSGEYQSGEHQPVHPSGEFLNLPSLSGQFGVHDSNPANQAAESGAFRVDEGESGTNPTAEQDS